MLLPRRPLVLLAVLFVAMLVVGGCGSDDDAATSKPDKAASVAKQDQPDAPETPRSNVEVEVDPDLPALHISTRQVDSVGTPATAVVEIGALVIDGPRALERATEAFGEPDTRGASDQDANVCEATWNEFGLTLQFYFGHPPSLKRSCDEGIVAGAFMVEQERWVVVPGGLHVGDPADRISEAFPAARAVTLSPGIAAQLGVEAGYAIADGAYGGDASPILFAAIDDGVVVGLAYVSLAD